MLCACVFLLPEQAEQFFLFQAQVGGNISLTNDLLSILVCVCFDQPGDEEDRVPKSVLPIYKVENKQPVH